jgi:hypothetical protein
MPFGWHAAPNDLILLRTGLDSDAIDLAGSRLADRAEQQVEWAGSGVPG